MTLHVLTGPDGVALRSRVAALCAQVGVEPEAVERFDMSGDGGEQLLVAAATFSLFGGARMLVGAPLGALHADTASRLAAGRADAVTVILCATTAPTAAARRALEGATFATFANPTPRDAAARVAQSAEGCGVQLDRDAHALLTGLAPENWGRVQEALAQLAELGQHDVGVDLVRPFVGTVSAATFPWTLSDALESGDLARALDIAGRLDAIPTVAYLSKRVGQLGMALEADGQGDAESPAADRRLIALARRLGPHNIDLSWDLIAAADRASKLSSDPAGVLAVLVVRLTTLWGRSRA